MQYNRRNFLQTLALAGASLPLKGLAYSALAGRKWEVHCFSKPFQWMDYDMLAETFAAAGLDGIDYSIRPEGHILPERVGEDLPKAALAARKRGLKLLLMTTAIADATEPYTVPILKAAAEQGIRYYRTAWFDYDQGMSLPASIQRHAEQLQRLAAVNQQYHLQASYQNHAGTKIGAAVWDLNEMIKPVDAAGVGVQYDIRHATVEGANSWPLGLQLIAPRINTIVIKDTRWVRQGNKYVLENMPLGEGMVDFAAYFKWLKQLGVHVPISLHLEYDLLSKQEATLPVKEKQQIVLGKLKKDVDTLRRMLANV